MSRLQKDFNLLKAVLESVDFDLSDAFIAGGALRDHFKGKDYKDIDIYTTKNKSKLLSERLKRFGSDVLLQSESATTLKISGILVPVQIIHKMEGDADNIISRFDFTINAHYLKFSESFESLEPKNNDWSLKLLPNIETPQTLVHRLMKFSKDGYPIQNSELVKLFFEVQKSLADREYLKYADLSGFYAVHEENTENSIKNTHYSSIPF